MLNKRLMVPWLGAVALFAGCDSEIDVQVQPGPPLRSPIQPAETCKSCHINHYNEWKGSLMAYMNVSPFFNGLEISIQELVGRNNSDIAELRCPDGAGVLRRLGREDLDKAILEGDPVKVEQALAEIKDRACILPAAANPLAENALGHFLPITGAGGEHWCVNCHVMGESTLRTFVPDDRGTPLIEGVPPWDKRDTPDGRASRRPLFEILRNQANDLQENTAAEGTEGRTLLQGASCDACHQITHPALSVEEILQKGQQDEADALAYLNDPLDQDFRDSPFEESTYQGNPYWTSFIRPEDEDPESSPCFNLDFNTNPNDDGLDLQRFIDLGEGATGGEPCKLSMREEFDEGNGIGNSGYVIDALAVPADELGGDPERRTAGHWSFGPLLNPDEDDPAPVDSTFHRVKNAPVDLNQRDDIGIQARAASVDDDRYKIPEGKPGAGQADYFRTAEFCGTCHDVRIIGTDTRKHVECGGDNPAPDCIRECSPDDPADCIASEVGEERFEGYKRLRDAYTEWRKSDYARIEKDAFNPVVQANRPGDSVVVCQDCHMSNYPVYFEPVGQEVGVDDDFCKAIPTDPTAEGGLPDGMAAFRAAVQRLANDTGSVAKLVKPGCFPLNQAATDDGKGGSPPTRRVSPHYFTGADVPLDPLANQEQFADRELDDKSVDAQGMIKGLKHRRDLLLSRSVRFRADETGNGINLKEPEADDKDQRLGLTLDVTIENVGAGHRIPAGFTQEREVWVEVVMTDIDRASEVFGEFTCGTSRMPDLLVSEVENREEDAPVFEGVYMDFSECMSAFRFRDLDGLDENDLREACTTGLEDKGIDLFEIASTSATFDEALHAFQQSLGVVGHIGALIDRDHDELVIGKGPGAQLNRFGSKVFDRLDYEQLFTFFDFDQNPTGEMLFIKGEVARVCANTSEDLFCNRLLLLDVVDPPLVSNGGFGPVFPTYLVPDGAPQSAEDTQGEIRLVERADGGIFDEDLTDKVFSRIRVNDEFFDNNGGLNGLIATYGADILDGVDKPLVFKRTENRITRPNGNGDTQELVGSALVEQQGMINFQNGFLRCISCCPQDATAALVTRGALDDSLDPNSAEAKEVVTHPNGRAVVGCFRGGQLLPDNEVPIDPATGTCCRGRFENGQCLDADGTKFPKTENTVDSVIDIDEGICYSNLVDDQGNDLFNVETGNTRQSKFLEVFSPIEGLAADLGGFKAADAIINERSLPPGIPTTFRDTMKTNVLRGQDDVLPNNLCVETRFHFRAFPPYEIRMFAAREIIRLTQGDRQTPAMSFGMVDKLDAVRIGQDTLLCNSTDLRSWTCDRVEEERDFSIPSANRTAKPGSSQAAKASSTSSTTVKSTQTAQRR